MYNLDYDGVIHADEDVIIDLNESGFAPTTLMLPIDIHIVVDKYDVRGLREFPA